MLDQGEKRGRLAATGAGFQDQASAFVVGPIEDGLLLSGEIEDGFH
jgi:hypothetical protein